MLAMIIRDNVVDERRSDPDSIYEELRGHGGSMDHKRAFWQLLTGDAASFLAKVQMDQHRDTP